MTAKEQYEFYNDWCYEFKMELNKGMASFLLTIPLEISYESWVQLHKIKGDYE